jgi:hypothetical protein
VSALLLEPMEESGRGKSSIYQPCRLWVNHDAQSIVLHNVVREATKLATNGLELPPLPSEWQFTGKEIQRVSLHNEDDLCLYMYVVFSPFFFCFVVSHAMPIFPTTDNNGDDNSESSGEKMMLMNLFRFITRFANQNDFQLFFPSPTSRNLFYASIRSLNSDSTERWNSAKEWK